jgi:hypothetical protein
MRLDKAGCCWVLYPYVVLQDPSIDQIGLFSKFNMYLLKSLSLFTIVLAADLCAAHLDISITGSFWELGGAYYFHLPYVRLDIITGR